MKYLILILLLIVFFLPLSKANAASLSLSPSTLTLNPGEQQTLTLSLDPQGASVIGTDVYLKYDSHYLKVISVVNLNVFPGMPATLIQNDLGLTKFSLINNYGTYQKTTANIATITIQALNPISNTTLTFDYSPGKTQDTNVAIDGGIDTLTSVTSATLIINSFPTNPTASPPSPTPSNAPPAGASPTLTPTKSLPQPTRRPITPPGQMLTSAPLAPGFVSPLAEELASTKPTDTPTKSQVLGTSTKDASNKTWGYLFLSFIIAAFFTTLGLIVYLIRKPATNSTYA